MSNQQEQPDQSPKRGKKRIAINIPNDLEAVYANIAFISHTPAEIVIDFAQVLPRMPKGNVKARIIMSPMHAKLLQAALAQQIKNYERQFGEIPLPPSMSLANQFFRFRSSGDDNDTNQDGEDDNST